MSVKGTIMVVKAVVPLKETEKQGKRVVSKKILDKVRAVSLSHQLIRVCLTGKILQMLCQQFVNSKPFKRLTKSQEKKARSKTFK